LQWKEAIDSELKSHSENRTWTLVDEPPPRRSIIGSMWVFKVIYNQSDGSVERFKARLVARSDSLKSGDDFNKTYAPVARFTSFRLLMEISAHHDIELEHVDISTAYLNLYENIDTEIYMRQKPGCKINGHENKVCKLFKINQQLKQAGRIWNSVFHYFLIDSSFTQYITDECLYVANLANNRVMFVLIYVDDMIISTNSKTALGELKSRIKTSSK
jgi:hypothetical protein